MNNDNISRQAAKNALTVGFAFHDYAGGTACAIIDDIPPADVVPVVRCRDCDSWNEDDTYGYETLGNLVCSCSVWSTEDTATRIFTGPDEFCSRGVRREDNLIFGMCCDCIVQGPCCSWDENESCPRYKDDGSCWIPANYDNPELLEGD